MSDWPGPIDYRDAFQHPNRIFKDSQLGRCEVGKNRMGMPASRAGGFALVYKLTYGSAATAVRVFLHPNSDREARYRIVRDHLARNRPKCLVHFDYQPDGVRIGTTWFPIQTMEWVNGETLGEWVKQAVQQNRVAALRRMADQWMDLIDDLRSNRIAHGDLQHGNVMVVNDTPMLVDYDGMCVPGLVGQPAVECGMPAYQHPRRNTQKLHLDLDHFSAWIILIALRAIAADLDLYRRYVEEPANDNILFTEDDLAHPARSTLWPVLLKSADPDVPGWTRALIKSIPQPFDRVPRFEIDHFGPLREAVGRRDWAQIQALASTPRLSTKKFPPELARSISEADRRVRCRGQLRDALAQNTPKITDPRCIVAAYNKDLLEDWEECEGDVKAAQPALELVRVLDQLKAAAANPGDGQGLVALWARSESRLGDVDEARVYGREAAQWQVRIAKHQGLIRAIAQAAGERAIAAAWKELGEAGGHPNLTTETREQVALAHRRLQCLGKLRAIPNAGDEKSDEQFAATWDDELLKDCREAAPWRSRQADVEARRRQCRRAREVVAAARQGLATDRDVLDAIKPLGAEYAPDLADQLQRASRRLASSQSLHQILQDHNPSDKAIARAYLQAKKDGYAPQPKELARCLLALRRCKAMQDLDKVDTGLPLDQQDAAWLASYQEPLLKGCVDAGRYRKRYAEAVVRTRKWEELVAALDGGDIARIKALSVDSDLSAHPGLASRQAEIQQFIREAEQADRLLRCLRDNNPRDFFAQLDLALLRTYPAAFRDYRPRIEKWVRDHIFRPPPLKPDPSRPRSVPAGGTFLAFWTWDHTRIIRSCEVATDPQRFPESPDPAHDLRIEISHFRRANGMPLALPRGCRRLFVTVWPVVDLEWVQLWGEPLRLGPFADGTPVAPGPTSSASPKTKPLRRILKDWISNF
jgi:hypothetical protein